MASRKLEDTSIEAMCTFTEFEMQLNGKGIQFVRACTYRSSEEQNDLYAQGRMKPGRIVTWARGGQSPHNKTRPSGERNIYGKNREIPASSAADYYPLLNGKLCNNDSDEEKTLWEQMGRIGRECGLEWGGDWTNGKRDMPHFQMPEAKKG
jgi:peptidoglycan L-alanyl-D-glutamate endopeptidase CwlK